MFQAFKPVITFERPEKGKSQWKSRLVAAILLIGTFYMLYSNTPDVDLIKEEARKAHESLLDYLVIKIVFLTCTKSRFNRSKSYQQFVN